MPRPRRSALTRAFEAARERVRGPRDFVEVEVVDPEPNSTYNSSWITYTPDLPWEAQPAREPAMEQPTYYRLTRQEDYRYEPITATDVLQSQMARGIDEMAMKSMMKYMQEPGRNFVVKAVRKVNNAD